MSFVVTSSSRSTNALPLLPRSRATAGGVAIVEGAGRSRSAARSCSSSAWLLPLSPLQGERGLGAGDPAGELGAVGVVMAGDGAGGVHDVVEPVGDEAARGLVVARLRAALEEQRGATASRRPRRR